MKLGRKHTRRDGRTMRFEDVLRSRGLPPIPPEYCFDNAHPGIPIPMFANDAYPCCVTSGRANHTLRFEAVEQGCVIPISDDDVLAEWRDETGGANEGLVVLDSLKAWRKDGWMAAGKNYKIHAFASVDACNTDHVKAAIYAFGSVGVGFDLPLNVTRDLEDERPWIVVSDETAQADPEGGHYVCVVGYDSNYVLGITWGRKQLIGLDFLEAYAAEIYAIVDDRDGFQVKNFLDLKALDSLLTSIAG